MVGEGVLESSNSLLLLLQTRDSKSIDGTLVGPAALANDNTLVLLEFGLEACDGALEPFTSLIGAAGWVEESMGVNGAVVGLVAELGVRSGSNKGVDSNNRTLVAGFSEDTTSLANGTQDLLRGRGTVVDKLIANADCVDNIPVAVDTVDDLLGLAGNRVNVPDTEEDLHVGVLGALIDSRDLVTVGTVDTDEGVRTGEMSKVVLDLGGSLALVIGAVRGIRDAGKVSAVLVRILARVSRRNRRSCGNMLSEGRDRSEGHSGSDS